MVVVGPVTEENLRKVDLSTLKPNRPDVVNNRLEILAGPLLRFWGLADAATANGSNKVSNGVWRGSISYVTRDANSNYDAFPTMVVAGKTVPAPYRYANISGISFWRFDIDLPTHEHQSLPVAYQLGEEHKEYTFWIPGQSQTMRSLFYSCNGFSLSVDTSVFPACLWDDVLRKHQERLPNPVTGRAGEGSIGTAIPAVNTAGSANTNAGNTNAGGVNNPGGVNDPYGTNSTNSSYSAGAQGQPAPSGTPNPFHVMLGGGDQLYCDSINLVLPENTLKSRDALKEDAKMRELVDKFYLHRYVEWYGRGYWKGPAGETWQYGWVEALATIPSLNIYDDHDIIDGYGTYRDRTMRSPVFKMIGEYAYRYYMLFQQNVDIRNDPRLQDPSWVSTNRPGPYIEQPARSIFARLGQNAAFLGLDCRTERRKDQVCAPDHYQKVYQRIRREVGADPRIKHVYVMLGVPIAYPRMVWAENLMSSKLIAPIKWLSKKGIILKGLVNPFDGDVELLDDLNDHWTAKHHKRERNTFLGELMKLQRDLSIRVTILAGDVHLCAVGAFASIKTTPPERDASFMVCPVSSAIVNTPPPPALADFMNRRNRTHVLGTQVVERMLPIFSTLPDGDKAGRNKTMMAKRNYCILDPVPEVAAAVADKPQYPGPAFSDEHHQSPDKHNRAVNVVPHSIKMTLMVEKDNRDSSAVTVPYSMYIPAMMSK